MARTELESRTLPDFARGEQIFAMVVNICAGGFACVGTLLCLIFSVIHGNWWGLISTVIYGGLSIFHFTMSSVYHGLKPERAKKVFQVLDKATLYALFSGAFAPVLFTCIRQYNLVWFLLSLLFLIAFTAVGVTFTSIDFHQFRFVVTPCCLALCWFLLFVISPVYKTYGLLFIILYLSGSLLYTVSLIIFEAKIKARYIRSVFLILSIFAFILQFVAIFKYCI